MNNYNKLHSSGSGDTPATFQVSHTPNPPSSSASRRRTRILFVSLISILLITASAVSAAVLIHTNTSHFPHNKPTQAISHACSHTLYPSLCRSSLLSFPGSLSADVHHLVHISLNLTLQHLTKALYASSQIPVFQISNNPLAHSAYQDCIELLNDAVDAFSLSLFSTSASNHDIMTWLSAALTYHDTCSDGFADVDDPVKDQMAARLSDLSEMISNSLAIFSGYGQGLPVQNRRRLMESDSEWAAENGVAVAEGEFPGWVSGKDRRLLAAPISAIQADIVVAKDGSGKFTTVAEAIEAAPSSSGRRIVIYIKAGKYEEENLKVGRKKTNLMFVGDGKGITVISGGKSVFDKVTTFRTATFAGSGTGIILRDMTFENTAGPSKHQAVALRVSADHAVVYRCNIIGYQDTLYVHSNRQFFRECDIYGTVDFIFGNAVVVFQSCNIYARKPMPQQKNTITAQNRKDPNQNTGISIHACKILATTDLEASKGSFPTFLGRPWKLYSRVVYMVSSMGDHIHPRGWLEWQGSFALDTLYYGEYMNSGPGAATGQRVNWPGYRVITSTIEATKFTVGQFIYGSSWLPSTGVSFSAGLSTN
ncbi:probable pectinesterase/pectinesterase inhibitor 61 [Cucurbita pepo subsp. pepo]|uniref:probable pectinesterase/pectinesterase inhibitor 61 n=1 Tax=Cucurbita pepo subsp. pepo TaxID=3664 RepID=UPI000C9D769E|nr:probable pectinesterase/pectinesterase inhibitor 61 [Cucurbita pepo subsp. pepo]